MRAMLATLMYSLALFGIMSMLTGCEAARAVYHACKDGNCR